MDQIAGIDGLIHSIETAGGYAALLGLGMFFVAMIVIKVIADQSKRSQAREEQIRLNYETQLSREQQNAQQYHATTERMVTVVEGNTKAITTLVETVRPMSETLLRLDRHINKEDDNT